MPDPAGERYTLTFNRNGYLKRVRGMTAAASRSWFFVHLQKTAGTALLQRLRDAFGDEAIYPTVSDN